MDLQITLVTSSKSKKKEIETFFRDHGISINCQEYSCPEIQGDCCQIAKQKVSDTASALQLPQILIDDTSLHFAAWGGMPGPYIKHFVESMDINDIWSQINASNNPSATAVCTLSYLAHPKAEPQIFQGKVTGTIVAPQGDTGFGWDCIFKPDGYDKTFAESPEIKQTISHRRKALEALLTYLKATNQ